MVTGASDERTSCSHLKELCNSVFCLSTNAELCAEVILICWQSGPRVILVHTDDFTTRDEALARSVKMLYRIKSPTPSPTPQRL